MQSLKAVTKAAEMSESRQTQKSGQILRWLMRGDSRESLPDQNLDTCAFGKCAPSSGGHSLMYLITTSSDGLKLNRSRKISRGYQGFSYKIVTGKIFQS